VQSSRFTHSDGPPRYFESRCIVGARVSFREDFREAAFREDSPAQSVVMESQLGHFSEG
jgi:hypothetical protein